ncbi:BrnT family toxin [Chloroflexi bacterium CFX6]|nr:BrnT family toxin [Chloroflexi bacterium CFX6]
MRYDFDWDPNKERANIIKHGISFRRAAGVFRDADHLSIYDEEHSAKEDRWITLGIDETGILRVVVHTFEQIEEDLWRVRIISARKATRVEENQYNRMNQ